MLLKNKGGIVNQGTIHGNVSNRVTFDKAGFNAKKGKTKDRVSINQRSNIRRFLQEIVNSDSEFDAFCIDHFPDIYSKFSDSMDRIRKINILITCADLAEIETAIMHSYESAK